VLHPVVMCALVANAGAAVHGNILSISYEAAQKVYYSKVGHFCFLEPIRWYREGRMRGT